LSSEEIPSSPLAGGTDLLVRIRTGGANPQRIISLRDIPDLSGIRPLPDGGVAIGAMTPIRALETSTPILKEYVAIAEAAGKIGSLQVRNRATLGGNLCNAAPSADMAPPLMAYGATAIITDGLHDHAVPLEDFFRGPGQTVIERGELLTEIHIPAPQNPCFAIYLKACRSRMDIALVGVGLVVIFDPDAGVCRDMRLALGAVAPTPICVTGVKEIAVGARLNDTVIERVTQAADEAASPISDVRSSAAYRRILIEALTREALIKAGSWIQKGVDR